LISALLTRPERRFIVDKHLAFISFSSLHSLRHGNHLVDELFLLPQKPPSGEKEEISSCFSQEILLYLYLLSPLQALAMLEEGRRKDETNSPEQHEKASNNQSINFRLFPRLLSFSFSPQKAAKFLSSHHAIAGPKHNCSSVPMYHGDEQIKMKYKPACTHHTADFFPPLLLLHGARAM
jgi:hypothetical protein